jgi:hydroxyacyl-ACP dehydratase HTD2-like protein with hotdog domain
MTLLQARVADAVPGGAIADFSYRNVAPLYADEEMRLCVAQQSDVVQGACDIKLWAENRLGEVAVRADARIEVR